MLQSFLIQPKAGVASYLIFDTVLDGKHVFTACGQGRVRGKDAELTPTGQQTLFALVDYAQHQQLGLVMLQEIATLAAVEVKVRKALEKADQKSVVFFVCRDPHIYDAAIRALQPNYGLGGTVQ